MSKPKNLDALIKIEDAIKVLCRKTCHPGVFCPDTYCDEMWEAFDESEDVYLLYPHCPWCGASLDVKGGNGDG